MADKTLGQVAYEARLNHRTTWAIEAQWLRDDYEHMAAAIVAAHEERRWQAWDTVPQEVGDDKRLLAYNIGDKKTYIIWRTCDGWTDGEVDDDGCYAVWPLDTRVFSRWSPIPAPPQEVERGA